MVSFQSFILIIEFVGLSYSLSWVGVADLASFSTPRSLRLSTALSTLRGFFEGVSYHPCLIWLLIKLLIPSALAHFFEREIPFIFPAAQIILILLLDAHLVDTGELAGTLDIANSTGSGIWSLSMTVIAAVQAWTRGGLRALLIGPVVGFVNCFYREIRAANPEYHRRDCNCK